MMGAEWRNKLYFGDNLGILREQVGDASVDLIYLDPPFNSKADHNILFTEKDGQQSAAQITAFEDTWDWSLESERAYQEVIKEGPAKVGELLTALRSFLGQNDLMAYLTMMSQRLIELRRVLKPTGSIYLHCDPRASHYLKMLMDGVFGFENFLNEVVWNYRKWTNAARHFQKNHDVILVYCQNKGAHTFNKLFDANAPHSEKYARGWDTNVVAGGVRQLLVYDREKAKERIESGGYDRIVYREEQNEDVLPDHWEISILNSQAKERLGYPTQKPEALLERIIAASSNEGDLVLDPFCGGGTTVVAAERLNRRWIGIDITHLAVSIMKSRLRDSFGEGLRPYDLVGVPRDVESARALAGESEHAGRYQFEWWALGLVEARPAQDRKKGADGGVDGYINFFDDNSGRAKRVIVQVKSGQVNRGQIAALRGDMEREKAQMGLFITLHPPTGPMVQDALAAGFYEPEHFPDQRFPRLQILTIEELLAGKGAEYPHYAPAGTFPRAPRRRRSQGTQGRL